MKSNRILLILILIIVIALSFNAYATQYVSLINLIATPEKYDKRQVTIVGYAVIRFEAQGIFLSTDDAVENITINGLWLSFSEKQLARYKTLNDKYVIVEGTFDPSVRGHGALYSGAIINITRFEEH